MLTTTCIMCDRRISWNAVACPHCGDPGQKLRAKLQQEEYENNVQNGHIPGPPTLAEKAINVFFNTLCGVIIIGAIGICLYLMSSIFR